MTVDPASLVGAWELSRFVITFSDERDAIAPFGDDARGLLLYTGDGHVCAVLSRADRPPLTETKNGLGLERAHRAADDDKARAFDSYLSYAGRWRVEGDRVIHSVTLAAVPDVVGAVQSRDVTLEDEALTLGYDLATRSGATAHYELAWRRPVTETADA